MSALCFGQPWLRRIGGAEVKRSGPEECDQEDFREQERGGKPSVLTCPQCGGVLWEMDDEQQLRYRCHVGHEFDGERLLAQHSDGLASALQAAVRALRENASISRRLAA